MKQIVAVVLCASAVAPVWAAAPVGTKSSAAAKSESTAPGRAVLHLLPRQESFRFDPQFEETVGDQEGGLLAEFFAETGPIGEARDEEEPDPTRDKFRPILRDPRIREVFEPLGVLVEAPPHQPDESVLYAANRSIDAARAANQAFARVDGGLRRHA